jgi:hypothetical protein
VGKYLVAILATLSKMMANPSDQDIDIPDQWSKISVYFDPDSTDVDLKGLFFLNRRITYSIAVWMETFKLSIIQVTKRVWLVVTALIPSTSPRTGGTSITVYGNRFDQLQKSVLCKIGGDWLFSFVIFCNHCEVCHTSKFLHCALRKVLM